MKKRDNRGDEIVSITSLLNVITGKQAKDTAELNWIRKGRAWCAVVGERKGVARSSGCPRLTVMWRHVSDRYAGINCALSEEESVKTLITVGHTLVGLRVSLRRGCPASKIHTNLIVLEDKTMAMQWKKDVDATFVEAKANNKPVLLDFSAAPA
jgi:hypothetical protein